MNIKRSWRKVEGSCQSLNSTGIYCKGMTYLFSRRLFHLFYIHWLDSYIHIHSGCFLWFGNDIPAVCVSKHINKMCSIKASQADLNFSFTMCINTSVKQKLHQSCCLERYTMATVRGILLLSVFGCVMGFSWHPYDVTLLQAALWFLTTCDLHMLLSPVAPRGAFYLF